MHLKWKFTIWLAFDSRIFTPKSGSTSYTWATDDISGGFMKSDRDNKGEYTTE